MANTWYLTERFRVWVFSSAYRLTLAVFFTVFVRLMMIRAQHSWRSRSDAGLFMPFRMNERNAHARINSQHMPQTFIATKLVARSMREAVSLSMTSMILFTLSHWWWRRWWWMSPEIQYFVFCLFFRRCCCCWFSTFLRQIRVCGFFVD